MKPEPEFFVGYLDVPPGIGRLMRRCALGLVVGGVALASLLISRESAFAPAVFEYGEYREWTGTLLEAPYPRLLVDRPGAAAEGASAHSSFLLGTFGKRGAGAIVGGLDGRRVSLAGALAYSDAAATLEIEPGSLMDLGAGRVDAALEEDLGVHQLVGEILDSKCYSGVMKPGRGKPHRSCAVRCISGGIPPLFIAENSDGESVIFLLQDARGAAPGREILYWVAKPVRLRGRIHRQGDLRIFKAELDHIALQPN